MPNDSTRDDNDRLYDSLDVYSGEWRAIRKRRGRTAAPPRIASAVPGDPQEPPAGLVGLALSGGGIRSATFNLGVLQSLSSSGLLWHADYLSTVSGGGYIGGWWSAWLARARGTTRPLFPPGEATEALRYSQATAAKPAVSSDAAGASGDLTDDAHGARPDPVHHVRLFSSYLTPRKGAMSHDLWRAITVVGRNLALTWLVLVPILAIPIILAQALFAWNYYLASPTTLLTPGNIDPARWRNAAELPLTFLTAFTLLSVAWLLSQRGAVLWQRVVATVGLGTVAVLVYRALPSGSPSPAPWLCVVVLAIVALKIWIPEASADSEQRAAQRPTHSSSRDMMLNRISRLQGTALVGAVLSAAITIVAAFGHELVHYLFFAPHDGAIENATVQIGKYGALLTSAASILHAGHAGAPAGGAESAAPPTSKVSKALIAIAPWMLMLLLVLTISWLAAVLVMRVGGEFRQWITLMDRITRVGLLAMVLLALIEDDNPRVKVVALLVIVATGSAFWHEMVARSPIASAIGLAAAVLPFLLLGRRLLQGPATLTRAEGLVLAAAAVSIVAVLFGGGIVTPPEPVNLLLGVCGALGTTVLLLGWTSDPNTLSLHNFYKSRLVRAYLAASNPLRAATDSQDITEAKPDDDVLLAHISDPEADTPYHLINGTLNLTSGSDLVIAQRAAAPFLFSRLYCGSARTGFRATDTYRSGTLTLGTAVAISGAAASPVMGSQTPSTAVSMLMALLNVRLGYWLPTPGGPDWRAPQARFWPFYLLREFLSHTAETGRYCYVTDGGHFDNTGAYSLVERGCRLIVLTDCGADPDVVFDDLANLVRRCRIDFGTHITFDLHPFSRETMAKDRRHFVVGSVFYSAAHLKALGYRDPTPALEGTLIVVKPTLVAELETDVNRYSQMNSRFPQQSTADQWFDEAQFESYRRLGERSGEAACDVIARHIAVIDGTATPMPHESEIRNLESGLV